MRVTGVFAVLLAVIGSGCGTDPSAELAAAAASGAALSVTAAPGVAMVAVYGPNDKVCPSISGPVTIDDADMVWASLSALGQQKTGRGKNPGRAHMSPAF